MDLVEWFCIVDGQRDKSEGGEKSPGLLSIITWCELLIDAQFTALATSPACSQVSYLWSHHITLLSTSGRPSHTWPFDWSRCSSPRTFAKAIMQPYPAPGHAGFSVSWKITLFLSDVFQDQELQFCARDTKLHAKRMLDSILWCIFCLDWCCAWSHQQDCVSVVWGVKLWMCLQIVRELSEVVSSQAQGDFFWPPVLSMVKQIRAKAQLPQMSHADSSYIVELLDLSVNA